MSWFGVGLSLLFIFLFNYAGIYLGFFFFFLVMYGDYPFAYRIDCEIMLLRIILASFVIWEWGLKDANSPQTNLVIATESWAIQMINGSICVFSSLVLNFCSLM